MYNPCFECMNRYGKQYTEECNNTCDYAYAVKRDRDMGESMIKDIHILLGNWFCALEDEGCPNPFEYPPSLEMANKYGYTNEDYINFKKTIS